MKRCAEFRKLVVDGKPLAELIRLKKVKGGLVVPEEIVNKLHLKGIELVETTNEEVFEYLARKWNY